ncbi:tRNA (adenosine(37)-N6)-threonylcarbamoyltransferase complex transferase subunit TsaD [Acetobacteraceae bacterium]|nr:tRNA (adenosine(37)-N6)-threonylcarbamoyltransferase complex transferase subunit TsaD [Acetobacteraceae bacterium]
MRTPFSTYNSTSMILALESSCDDTACAIMDINGNLLSHSKKTQIEHFTLGGVVPEVAARAHLSAFDTLIEKSLLDANVTLNEISRIAATIGPGLIGGLLTANGMGRGISIATRKNFVGINHIEAHILSPLFSLTEGEKQDLLNKKKNIFPFLALLFSGGHCQCVLAEGISKYTTLGGTIDDSIGEAFDKVAKMLGLGWPGGPKIEQIAHFGNSEAFNLPRPLKGRDGCDFSFSGLKTAVRKLLEPYKNNAVPLAFAADLAASFQKAVLDVVVDRTNNAIKIAQSKAPLKLIAVGGGVACNTFIRDILKTISSEHKIRFLAAEKSLCPDNATMVAWTALLRNKWGEKQSPFQHIPRPRWPLKEMEIL